MLLVDVDANEVATLNRGTGLPDYGGGSFGKTISCRFGTFDRRRAGVVKGGSKRGECWIMMLAAANYCQAEFWRAGGKLSGSEAELYRAFRARFWLGCQGQFAGAGLKDSA